MVRLSALRHATSRSSYDSSVIEGCVGKRSVAAGFLFIFFAFVAAACVFKGLVCPIIEMLPMLMRYGANCGRKEGRKE